MGKRGLISAVAGFALLGSSALATDPLSAIEWLEKRPKQIVTPLDSLQSPAIDEPPVADSVTTPHVSVAPLGAPQRAAAGLLPSAVTGLPRALWAQSDADDLIALIDAQDSTELPALQSLLYTLLLAEADPPQEQGAETFLRARIQKLLDLGALDPAQALLDRADPASTELFDLYFSAALLSGDANAPCSALRATPSLSPDLSARIYCDAQAQDWDKAALTLTTGDAIGAIDAGHVALLERFLDPEMFEDVRLPPPPSKPSALQFRLFEAAGEPLPAASLPRVFSATHLNGDAGWKAQIEAAERLARVGAISENRLFGIYTSATPSASGGVWDRAEAIQRLDVAIGSGDPAAILKQAEQAWSLMQAAGLQVPFSTLFAEALLRLPSSGATADLVTRIALLSPLYEQAAQRDTRDERLKLAQGVAIGEVTKPGPLPIGATLHAVFGNAPAPDHLTTLAKSGRLGEAILRANALTLHGASGDPGALQGGLSFLRSAGLEDTARRTALQLLLLQDGASQ